MNREIRDGEADESKEVRLCKRATQPPRLAVTGPAVWPQKGHCDWSPTRGLAADTDVHHSSESALLSFHILESVWQNSMKAGYRWEL